MPFRSLGARNSGLGLQHARIRPVRPATFTAIRFLASQPPKASSTESISEYASDSASSKASSTASSETSKSTSTTTPPPDWEDNPNYDISHFSELPHTNFGVNQHIVINDEFKEALRQILWQFRAPIRYAFAYGSGVFPQSKQVRKRIALWIYYTPKR